MLDITGNDITELNDTDLRSLIGLLCEAELHNMGLPIAGVTWGGHQNASDGGIDVRVEVDLALQNDGFIPRSNTGFQVKNLICQELRLLMKCVLIISFGRLLKI